MFNFLISIVFIHVLLNLWIFIKQSGDLLHKPGLLARQWATAGLMLKIIAPGRQMLILTPPKRLVGTHDFAVC